MYNKLQGQTFSSVTAMVPRDRFGKYGHNLFDILVTMPPGPENPQSN